MKKAIPKNLQSLLWSADVASLDLEKHKSYIVNQALMYGTIDELQWLFTTFSKKEIRNVFINTPDKIYTPAAFYFAKTILLNIEQQLQPERYVRTFPRRIGP